MKSKRYLYGLMGLLSLLGFIGIFTEAKSFLAFFAFAVDFEYFFIKSDEMLEEYMNKSASRAFYCGMISVALVSFVCFFFSFDIAGFSTGLSFFLGEGFFSSEGTVVF